MRKLKIDQAVFLGTNFSRYNLTISGNLFPMFVAHEKPLTVRWLQWRLSPSSFSIDEKEQKSRPDSFFNGFYPNRSRNKINSPMDIYNQFMELRGSNSILTGRSHSILLSLDQNPKMNRRPRHRHSL